MRPVLGATPVQPYLKRNKVQTYYFAYYFFSQKLGRRTNTYVSTGETDYKRALKKRQIILEKKQEEISRPQVEKSEYQSINSLIAEYFVAKSSEWTLKTLSDYRYDLARFEKYADGKPLIDIDRAFLQEYLVTIKGRNTDESRSSYAQQKARRYLSSLFGFAVQEGKIERNPVEQLKLKKVNKRIRDYFKRGEFEAFWRRMPESTFSEASLKNLCLLASGCGGREFELCAIELSDIQTDLGLVNLRHTKNGEPRSIKITARVQQAIERQIAAKHLHKKEAVRNSKYLFTNEKGQILISADRKTNPIPGRFQEVRKTILLHREGLHFHSLRHSFIQNGIDLGVPEIRISKYVGHTDLQTTLRNYTSMRDIDWRDEERLTLPQYLESLAPILHDPVELKATETLQLHNEPSHDLDRIRQHLVRPNPHPVRTPNIIHANAPPLADAA